MLLIAALLALPLDAKAQKNVPPAPQEPILAPSADEAHPYTLHVYTNLVQVPTLILDTDGKTIPGLTRDQVKISLDEGPGFAPTLMRPEGDDPISIVFLLDASGDQRAMLRSFAADFAKVAPAMFKPADRVSFYALDCTLHRTVTDETPSSELLHRQIENVLAAPGLHGTRPKAGCSREIHIFDALTNVITELSRHQGRRVLVIVSEVHDHGSKVPLDKLVTYAGAEGVAVFGLRDAESHDEDLTISNALRDAGPLRDLYGNDKLAALVGHNGGLITNVQPFQMPLALVKLMNDIRSRYILEFPRPNNQEPGLHGISISVPSMRAFAHPAGVSTPLPDPALLNDPTTIPTSNSPAVMGTHRPKQP